MSWQIDNHPDGGMQITHLGSPRFTARWTTGDFPIESVREGAFFWTDEGSGAEDAIHLYAFTWRTGMPSQEALEAAMREAVLQIDRYVTNAG
ncbi:hypothetical protein [Dinoroseobacter sp. S76]|uniref:hypothetical protein n=1 Tax=Dinoroseobacter sp. S76 TaxID=3415124 RepID=UPI003C7BA16D